ncbi:MAG: TerC family protein [Chloroflexia bacterium]|nr:TerC family protein [Chloroflexia bacterium]
MAIFNPANLVTLITLALLEIVLGIDNVIFIAILSGRLPASQQNSGRQIGLIVALLTRILLLLSLTWIMRLVEPLFTLAGNEISGRDLILLVGGLFLITKSTMEMHHSLEGADTHVGGDAKKISFWGTIAQIAVLDIVFSLDSVITAVGLANEIAVMIVAIVVAVIVMLAFSGALSRYIEKHPTIKILALSFLSLIGMSLVAEGLDFHIEKGYIYFAMAFSVVVELINIRMRASQPVKLHSIAEAEEPHS